jgi:hypothetical protein
MPDNDAPALTARSRELLAKHAEAVSKAAAARKELEDVRAKLLRSNVPVALLNDLIACW